MASLDCGAQLCGACTVHLDAKHFFDDREDELVKIIAGFLDKTLK